MNCEHCPLVTLLARTPASNAAEAADYIASAARCVEQLMLGAFDAGADDAVLHLAVVMERVKQAERALSGRPRGH